VKTLDGLSLTAVLAVSAAMLAGCDQDNGWGDGQGPVRVCVDQQGRRVAEDQCATPRPGGGNPFLWYYLGRLNRGAGVPAYGGAVSGGSYQASSGVSYGSAPAAGISRGGFGSTAEGFGGEGAGE